MKDRVTVRVDTDATVRNLSEHDAYSLPLFPMESTILQGGLEIIQSARLGSSCVPYDCVAVVLTFNDRNNWNTRHVLVAGKLLPR